MSEPNEELKDDYTPPSQVSNMERAEAIGKELGKDRDALREKLNAENNAPVDPGAAVEEETPAKEEEKPEISETPPEPVYDAATGRYRDPVTKAFVAAPKPKETAAGGKEGVAAAPKGDEATAPAGKDETPYAKATRAEKDAQRLARVVEQRQREVEEARREAAEWRARAEQGPSGREEARRETDTKFNSDQFARAADEFTTQGFKHLENDDAEAAMEAFSWARKAQTQAQQAFKAEQEQAVRQQQEGFTRTWADTVQDVIAEAKEQGIDLMDETNEVSKGLEEILDSEPILNYLPDGFRKTWELYQLRKAYEELPKANQRIAELEAEVAKLTGQATPSKGSRMAPRGPKKFEDMTMSEQREYLKANQYK